MEANNLIQHHINVKEHFEVFTWGNQLKDKQIILYTDNEALYSVWQSGSSKGNNMHYIKHLFLFVAKLNISLLIKHTPGYSNVKADLLSHLQVSRFHQLLSIK